MVSRAEVVNRMTGLFARPRYLEIGVAAGETFLNVSAATKVAVDPNFNLDVAAYANSTQIFYETTSDEYFSKHNDPQDKFDVVYIDGLHTFEQTLRDFTNAMESLSPNGIVVIDDVLPTSYAAALSSQLDAMLVKQATDDDDNSWMGDTYKLVYFIHAFFPSLRLRTVNDNHGQAVVWRTPRAAADFQTYSIQEICSLEFLDVIKNQACFGMAALDKIVTEITSSSLRI